MRFFGIDPVNQKRLAILVPLVALALSLFVVYPTWLRYREDSKQVQKLKQELVGLQTAVDQLKATPPDPVVASVDDAPSEPPQFLEQIRRMSADSDCRLVGFEALPPGADDPKSLIRVLHARVTLEARYPDIRAFVEKLRNAPRLYTVTDVNITLPSPPTTAMAPTVGALRAVIEVERYVTPEAMQTALTH